MILSYKLFLRTGRDRLLSNLQVKAKKHYPTSLGGIGQSGLEDNEVAELRSWSRAHPHISERLIVAIFIKYLMRECGRGDYVGQKALLDWLGKQTIREEDNREIASFARRYAQRSMIEENRDGD